MTPEELDALDRGVDEGWREAMLMETVLNILSCRRLGDAAVSDAGGVEINCHAYEEYFEGGCELPADHVRDHLGSGAGLPLLDEALAWDYALRVRGRER